MTLVANKSPSNYEQSLTNPKPTEIFISDIHGENDLLSLLMKAGFGEVGHALHRVFKADISNEQKHCLTDLIMGSTNLSMFSELEQHVLHQQLCQLYQAVLPQASIPSDTAEIVNQLAKQLVGRVHVVGDIYDRGDAAEKVLDQLIDYGNVDVQWGNHDVVWIGAAGGSAACVATVVRIALRYASLDTLTKGYGIQLGQLYQFANRQYSDDPAICFQYKGSKPISADEKMALARMQKAISIIQFKLESHIIERRPQYDMDDRKLLSQIQGDNVTVNNAVYPLLDSHFPTIDSQSPCALTDDEQAVIDGLVQAFRRSQRLQKHVRFLLDNGSMYQKVDHFLLFHGCIPLESDGTLMPFDIFGTRYQGKQFLDRVDRLVRQGYYCKEGSYDKSYGLDATWYLWCGRQSPLFGKDKMATFERYFIADKTTHAEGRNAYYALRSEANVMKSLLAEFGLDQEQGKIINGHVPVKVKNGEQPVKADGKLVVIDGGFAEAYSAVTGISGYIYIYTAEQERLVALQRKANAVLFEDVAILNSFSPSLTVGETTKGSDVRQQLAYSRNQSIEYPF